MSGTRRVHRATRPLVVLAFAAGVLIPPAPAHAAAIAVTTTADEFGTGSDCSLREAIRAANTDMPFGGCPTGSGADTITLGTDTYTLSVEGSDEDATADGDLDILSDLTILGAGAGSTEIDGNGAVTGERVFDVDPPGDAEGFMVRVQGLTVRGGAAGPTALYGGGFRVSDTGKLTIEDLVVSQNTAENDGGGIFTQSEGSITVRDTTVTGNFAGDGAGVAIWDQSTFSLTRTVVRGNTITVSTGEGAGVLIWNQSQGSIVGSTVSGNLGAQNAGGMQIWNEAIVTIAETTVSGNTATGYGGGLEIENQTQVSITNTTISGNTAGLDGGGIVTDFGTPSISLNNVTVAGNTADADGNGTGDGGGLAFNPGTTPVVTLRNTIVANNVDRSGQAPDCAGEPITRAAPNLIESLSGCSYTPGAGDVIGQDPKLGPLTDNGGPAETHALSKGSPAIGTAGPGAEPTDQRGLPRKDPDIGAYERVLCAKVAVNRIGTNGKDKLRGTNGPDGMLGLGGKDTLNGKGGKDGLCGGGGKDKLKGGGGKDRMKGQGGKDVCVGGGGTDKATCERETKVP